MKKSLAAGIVTAASAAVLLAGTPAFASDYVQTSGNGGVVAGNQAVVNADVPVNGCGNAVAVLGNAGASCWNSGVIVSNQ
nr:chaplin family protein [Streptomonospora nanhaiensis]